MSMYSASVCLAVGSALVFGAPAIAPSQADPIKPIRLVVPYGPGGVVDYVGRTLSGKLSEIIGHPVLVENLPGAAVVLGAAAVVRSAPDGHTLLLADPAIVIEPNLRPQLRAEIFDGLQTVSVVSSSPQVLVTALPIPVSNVAQLIAYGKANPGKLTFASAGFGTPSHLAGEMFKLRTGIEMAHVPYKGSGAPFTDLMTGKVQLAFSSLASALPFTTDKRVRAIATTGIKRVSVYADLPTIVESGLLGFEIDVWIAAFAPAGVPATALARLNGGLRKALALPDLQAALAKIGVDARGTEPGEGAAFIRDELEKWRQVIRDGKIKRG